jgi:putative ABC transport system permease protein
MPFDSLRQDLRTATRNLLRSPAFAAVTILTLALGIGANTAMFTVIRGVILKPLGYPEADHIVAVLNRWTDTGHTQANLAGGDEIDISTLPGTFEAFAYYQGGELGVQVGDQAELVGGQRVHPDFFRVFGVAPAAGRLFNRDDALRSAVVSLGFAQRHFGSAAGALGQSVSIGSRPHEIVGVMPAAMRFPAQTDVWAAAPVEPGNRNRSGHNSRAGAGSRRACPSTPRTRGSRHWPPSWPGPSPTPTSARRSWPPRCATTSSVACARRSSS